MNNLPNRPRSHETGKEGVEAVERLLPSRWTIQRLGSEEDYGLDLRVELFENNQTTGTQFYVQCKATDKIPIYSNGDIKVSIKTSTLSYFRQKHDLVILTLYDTQNETCYWIWIQKYIDKYLVEKLKSPRKLNIRIPKQNILNEEAVDEIRTQVLELHKGLSLVTAKATDSNEYFSCEIGFNKDGKQSISVIEKFAGASDTNPIQSKFSINIDDNLEGKNLLKQYEKFVKTGSTFTIDSKFLGKIETKNLPSFLNEKLDVTKLEKIVIGPAISEKCFFGRVEIFDRTGIGLLESLIIDFQFIQGGTEEILFSNEKQKIPFKISMRYNFKNNKLSFEYKINYTGLNVFEISQFLNFQSNILSNNIIKIVDNKTNKPIFKAIINTDAFVNSDKNFQNIIKKLVFIQDKLPIFFCWPGQFTKIELSNINFIYNVLKKGIINRSPFVEKLPLTYTQAMHFFNSYKEEPFCLPLYSKDFRIKLFGQEISLGYCTMKCLSVNFNKDTINILEKYQGKTEDKSLTLELELKETVEYIFDDWYTKK